LIWNIETLRFLVGMSQWEMEVMELIAVGRKPVMPLIENLRYSLKNAKSIN
jgi:hypothetical protein